jgi:hypothetical protein
MRVNGTNAYYLDDMGDWEADNVPVNPTGMATFDIELYTNDPVNIGSENNATPQPAVMGLLAYTSGYYNNETTPYGCADSPMSEVADNTTYWSYSSGGAENSTLSGLNGDCEPQNTAGGYSLPGGLNGFSPTWEINSYGGSYENPPYWFLVPFWDYWTYIKAYADMGYQSSSADAQVGVIPSGPAVAGQTATYIVQAQVIDEDLGIQIPANQIQFANQLAGTVSQDVTNSDGSIWTTAVVAGQSGANLEVTPHASGNISFDGMQVFKTKEAWQQDVRNEIFADTGGMADMNTYNPANGFMDNRQNLQAVYAFYQKLFGENGDLLWAGLGKLAGAPVYAGLSDAQWAISFGFFTNNLITFQNTLITMNTNILQDLAWQSEAYYKGGLQALNVIYAGETNALDLPTINAWREIDDGVQNDNLIEIQNGNLQLAHREQLTILQPDYDILNGMGGITNVMSILAQNPVPTGTNFITVVPGGNLCAFSDRWNWITNSAGGIWPSWTATDSTTQSEWVNTPLKTRAANYTTLPFLPIQ